MAGDENKIKKSRYLSHDTNARSDPKITQLISVYGFLGYGWFWALCEIMREEGGSGWKLSLQGKYIYNNYADILKTTPEKAKEFIEDCIKEFKLFESDDISFWSNRILRDVGAMINKSEKARASIEKRWEQEKQKERNTNESKIYTNVSKENTNESKNDTTNTNTNTNTNTSYKEKIYKKESTGLVDSAESPVGSDEPTEKTLEKPVEVLEEPEKKKTAKTKKEVDPEIKSKAMMLAIFNRDTINEIFVEKVHWNHETLLKLAKNFERFIVNDGRIELLKCLFIKLSEIPKTPKNFWNRNALFNPSYIINNFDKACAEVGVYTAKNIGQSAGGMPVQSKPPYNLPDTLWLECEWCTDYAEHTWDAKLKKYVCSRCRCEMRENHTNLSNLEFRERIMKNEPKDPEFFTEEEIEYANSGNA